MYIVSRQSLYLLDPPSAHKPSLFFGKPGFEPPTACLLGRRLNHGLGGPVGGYIHVILVHPTPLQWHIGMNAMLMGAFPSALQSFLPLSVVKNDNYDSYISNDN